MLKTHAWIQNSTFFSMTTTTTHKNRPKPVRRTAERVNRSNIFSHKQKMYKSKILLKEFFSLFWRTQASREETKRYRRDNSLQQFLRHKINLESFCFCRRAAEIKGDEDEKERKNLIFRWHYDMDKQCGQVILNMSILCCRDVCKCSAKKRSVERILGKLLDRDQIICGDFFAIKATTS